MSGSTSRLLAGIASITIDGDAFDVVDALVWNPSNVKRETLKGQTRVEGFSEMPEAGYIAGTLRDNGAFQYQAFNQMQDSTIVIEQANGKIIYGSPMWCVESQEVKTMDGTFMVRFEGPNVTEQLAV
jgi:Phage tail tube protein